MADALKKTADALRKFALGFPGATEEFPWGERVIKVNKKIFVFLGKSDAESEGFGLTVKLPSSGEKALDLPFTEPAGYGMGKKGWVSASFEPGDRPSMELLTRWIDESYRTIAPKKLVAQLDLKKPR